MKQIGIQQIRLKPGAEGWRARLKAVVVNVRLTTLTTALAAALTTVTPFVATAAPDATGLLVGRLATAERVIELWRVGDDTRYRVKTLEGEALSALLTETALEAEYPGLYKMVEQGVADDASLSPGMIDARHYEKRTPVPKQDFD